MVPEDNVEISVVVPLLNEVENLPELYDRLCDTLLKLKRTYEIIFIDDGSIDESFYVLKEIASADWSSSKSAFSAAVSVTITIIAPLGFST